MILQMQLALINYSYATAGVSSLSVANYELILIIEALFQFAVKRLITVHNATYTSFIFRTSHCTYINYFSDTVCPSIYWFISDAC